MSLILASFAVKRLLIDGRMLWEFTRGEPMMGHNVAQPVVWQEKHVMLNAGYDVGSVAFELKLSPSGWQAWNHPAIAGGKLLVRNAVEMACFDLR